MYTTGSLSLSNESQFRSVIHTLFRLLKNGLPTPSPKHQKNTYKHTRARAREVHAPDIIPSYRHQQKNVHTMPCTENTRII